MAGKNFIRIDGIDQLLAHIRSVRGETVDRETLEDIAFYLEQSILTRTGEGKDVSGKYFQPYSPSYRLFRMSKGRPVDKVRLMFWGTMLGALTHTTYKDRVELFFMNTRGKSPSGKPSKVSSPQKAYYLHKKRKFFGISREERERIMGFLRTHLRNLLEE